MVLLPSTAMNTTDPKDSFENKIGLTDKAQDMEKTHGRTDSRTDSRENSARERTQGGASETAKWINECQNSNKAALAKVLNFVGDVQEGIYVDVTEGQKKGEKNPAEFWARVWEDIHQSGGGPPDNLPHEVLKTKWVEMRNSGKSREDAWDHMEREYPIVFLLVPLLKRWHEMGQGKPAESVQMFDGLSEVSDIILLIDDKENLGDKLLRSREEGKEEDFWKEHWDDLHGVKKIKEICDGKNPPTGKERDPSDFYERWFFTHKRTDKTGSKVTVHADYKKHYPLGHTCYRRIRRSADERPIYKQFDFLS